MAVVVARSGRPPAGADEAVAEAGGEAVVMGSGALEAAGRLPSARRVWWAETATGAGPLAAVLAPVVAGCPLVVLPGSPDGRDLAPRLAARLGWPLLAGTVGCQLVDGRPTAELLRADGRVVVPVSTGGPAVATLWPGARSPEPAGAEPELIGLDLPSPATPTGEDAGRLIEPDPATMDLAEAPRVLGGGAGLVPPGTPDDRAREVFALLSGVAAALGASAGATRVVTDAGWMGYDRQIGTTGVTLDPELYVALGVSGASQHVGGLGAPRHLVSVNVDPSCPMTAMADLGLVTDAPALLVELARRLGVPVPSDIERAEA
ncbi:MAG TPA: mycofactocin-associated electron transfer flavoprotein alpha subunit [Acidimicrobiales bacterium]|nr:mycofactocin-associated electron transfer flavoprotein alpha subunit [Acidimicrobiales bacterium]